MQLRSLLRELFCLLGIMTLLSSTVSARSDREPAHIGSAQQSEIINQLQVAVNEKYFDELKAAKISKSLGDWKASSELKEVELELFTSNINELLQKSSNDRHLRLEFFPGEVGEPTNKNGEHDFSSEAESRMWHSQNMGFKKIERLPFNIGLIKMDAFAPVKYAAPLISSSFNFLKNTDVLIIDLRGNFGGYEYTAPLLASYLLDKKTHLFDMQPRDASKREQRWSHEKVDGPRYQMEKPVYILIDKHTFSAAETFAYTLKQLNRVTLIGETSAGASNAGEEVRLNKDFIAFIPTRKMINQITQSNFEGTGVSPDIESNSEKALISAQKHYLESLLKDENHKHRKARISKRLNELEEI